MNEPEQLDYEPEPYPLAPIYSVNKPINKKVFISSNQAALIEDQSFEPLVSVNLEGGRTIVISKRTDTDLWFNEKIQTKNFQGFTHKGFGLKIKDLDKFKKALSIAIEDPYASEFRISLNSKTEIVIYHPTLDTIDIRHYVTSDGYTGFLRKGIRLITQNAAVLLQGITKIKDSML